MAVQPEGMPCWADAMFRDTEGAKEFYGKVLGWTFGEPSAEFGNYTQAYSDGRAVAGVVPPMPGQQEGFSQWCLYFASPDAAATAERIRATGGTVLMEPAQVGDLGSMLIARDPGGVVFGVWQAGSHEGFEKRGEHGAYAWAEVFTREPGKADGFFPKVFPYAVQQMDDDNVDYRLFSLGGEPVLGRMEMTKEIPAEVSSYLNVFFAVGDCDAAAARAVEAGGTLVFGPMTTPFGRFATLVDPQGAAFSIIDGGTTEGEPPSLTDVA